MPKSERIWLIVAIAVGGGFLFLAIGSEAARFLTGAALVYLVAKTFNAGSSLDDLAQRLSALEKHADSAPAARPAPPAAPATPVITASAPASTSAPVPTSAPRPIEIPARTAQPPQAAPAASPWTAPKPAWTPPPPGPIDRGLAAAIAWLTRGNPVAKAGIVVLFLGAAFLAKYAVDHSIVPVELRMAGLGAGALALLVIGWRLRHARQGYAQVLQGGGIAGFYLTVFAATRLYHLLPPGLALPLLIAVAGASALLAVAQESLPLAVIGFAGGFLAPVLLSTGGGSHVALFTYYAVLNLGVFAVAWFRAWRILNLVGLAFTFSITGAWRAFTYVPENLPTADFFVLLFFAMYVAISILFALRQKPELRGYVSASMVFGLPVVAFGLHASMIRGIEYGLASSALAFGVLYLLLAWRVHASRHPSLGLLAEAFAALGVIFASMAIPLAFDARATAAMSSVEGAGLLWLGVRQDRKLARAFGVFLQVAAGFNFLRDLAHDAAATPVLNGVYIGALMLSLSGAFSARQLHLAGARLAHGSAPPDIALLWSLAWWLYGGLAELARFAPDGALYGMQLAFGAVTVAILAGLQHRWQWATPGRAAVALLPVVAAAGLLAARDGHPLQDWGFAGWPLLLAAGVMLARRAENEADDAARALSPWLRAGLYSLLALLAAWELSWQLKQVTSAIWPALPWLWVPLAMLWLAASRPRFRLLASAPLAAATLLWTLVLNLSSDGDPQPLPYLPLLNPLDVSSAAALATLAARALDLSPAERASLSLTGRRLLVVLGGLAFLWLNAALLRAVHYALDTPLEWHAIRHSFVAQASLSIFWTLLGLTIMTVANRRGARQAWIIGAGLMGVVVAKLFLVDLEGTGSIARIASFISVGLLMLLAGYLSPIPPDAPPPEEEEPA